MNWVPYPSHYAAQRWIDVFFDQTEHRNPEGRTYWYNPATKESVWEKPEGRSPPCSAYLPCDLLTFLYAPPELKTPFEVRL